MIVSESILFSRLHLILFLAFFIFKPIVQFANHCTSKVKEEYRDLKIFSEGKENIEKKVYSWFKNKAKILYDQEVAEFKTLSFKKLIEIQRSKTNDKQSKTNNEDSFSEKIRGKLDILKENINNFFDFITKMSDDRFDLKRYYKNSN